MPEVDTASSADARVAELEAEVARLKQQLAQRTGALFTLGGFSESALPPSQFTIAGLEERVLLVDAEGLIRYANSGMAELLGAGDKHELLRTSLAQWEGKGPVPGGLLLALVDATRNAGQTVTHEHELPVADSAVAALTPPPGVDIAPGQLRRMRFIGQPVEGRVQIVVQDVTYLRWIERSFERYVSKEVITQLLAVPQHELLRTERRLVTVLFTDLRGFTALCEQQEPAATCILLNQHFQHVVDAVHRQQGTVDKLMGDAVMAVFGAPLPSSRHALQALLAAADMLQAHAEWVERRVAAGWPILHLSVGIATGEVVAGNVGTPERMDFTVLGHAVNLASRLVQKAEPGQLLTEPVTHRYAKAALQDLNRQTGAGDQSAASGAGQSLLTGAELPHMSFAPIGTLSLKNISQPIDVLAVTFREA